MATCLLAVWKKASFFAGFDFHDLQGLFVELLPGALRPMTWRQLNMALFAA
jgi:hypothetical protein